MAGLKYTVAGADFSGVQHRENPVVTNGLLGWYWLGRTLEESLVNHAPGGADATVVGSGPAILPNGIQTSASTGTLDTGIVETQEMTLIAIGRGPFWTQNQVGCSYISAWTGAANKGIELCITGTGAFIGASYMISGATARRSADDLFGGPTGNNTEAERLRNANWAVVAGRVDMNRVTFRGYADGFERITTVTGATSRDMPLAPQTLRLCGRPDGPRLTTDLAFAAVYNRYLSDAELDQVYRPVSGAAFRRGVPVYTA